MTQVYTKMSPNGKMRLLMPKRQFVDYITHKDTIDGVVIVDCSYLGQERLIAAQLIVDIRYGREDDEVMGLHMSREMCVASVALNPSTTPGRLTDMQKDVLSKYPQGCFPFHFDWERNMGSTMFIEQKRGSIGKPCGMRYFVEIFSLLPGESRPQKRSSIHFDIEMIQVPSEPLSYSPLTSRCFPSTLISGAFLSPNSVQLELCLEKNVIMEDEPIIVHVTITNQSNVSIRKMKAALIQFYEISFSGGSRKMKVQRLESDQGFPISPGGTLTKTIILQSEIMDNSEGVAMRLSSAKNVLAATTIFPRGTESRTNYFGFIVSYAVNVKLIAMQAPFKTGIATKVPVVFVAKNLTADNKASSLKNNLESCT